MMEIIKARDLIDEGSDGDDEDDDDLGDYDNEKRGGRADADSVRGTIHTVGFRFGRRVWGRGRTLTRIY